jgi:hypothetical protein
MSDPNEQLSNFDPGPAMTPLPPSDVRRQGERLRRRNTLLAGVGAAVAVALVATPLVIIGARGGDATPDPAPVPPCRGQDCTEFRDALALVPEGPLAVTYVNRDLRADRLGLDEIGHDASQQDVDYYDRVIKAEQLVVPTTFGESLAVMHDKAAFSELDVDWEVTWTLADLSYAGAVRMDERLDLDAVGDDLVDAGYAEESVDGLRSFTIDHSSPDYNGFSGLISDRYPDVGQLTLAPERHLLLFGDPALAPLAGTGSALGTGTFDDLLGTDVAPETASLAIAPACTTGEPSDDGVETLGAPTAIALFFAADTAATTSVLAFDDEQAASDDLEARRAYLEPMTDLSDLAIRQDGRTVVLDYAYDDPSRLKGALSGLGGVHACWAPDDGAVLGPQGVDALRLGMTPQEIEATGEATSTQGSAHDGWDPGCEVLEFTNGRYEPSQFRGGRVSPEQGLEQIQATSDMATPEGIGIGASITEITSAYPDLRNVTTDDFLTVRASPTAVYRIQLAGTGVASMSLELNDQDCEI